MFALEKRGASLSRCIISTNQITLTAQRFRGYDSNGRALPMNKNENHVTAGNSHPPPFIISQELYDLIFNITKLETLNIRKKNQKNIELLISGRKQQIQRIGEEKDETPRDKSQTRLIHIHMSYTFRFLQLYTSSRRISINTMESVSYFHNHIFRQTSTPTTTTTTTSNSKKRVRRVEDLSACCWFPCRVFRQRDAWASWRE